MKRLALFLTIAPASAFAHGGHVELAGPAHDSFHVAPILGVALVGAVMIVSALRGRRE